MARVLARHRRLPGPLCFMRMDNTEAPSLAVIGRGPYRNPPDRIVLQAGRRPIVDRNATMIARLFALVLILAGSGGGAFAQTPAAAPDAAGTPPPPPRAKLVPPPPAPPPPSPPGSGIATGLNRYNDIDAQSPPGWGWCSYIDKDAKKAYYSSVFLAIQVTNKQLFGQSYTAYIGKFYAEYIKNTYADAGGYANCQWWPNATESMQIDAEKSDEFSQQIWNLKVVEAPWKP